MELALPIRRCRVDFQTLDLGKSFGSGCFISIPHNHGSRVRSKSFQQLDLNYLVRIQVFFDMQLIDSVLGPLRWYFTEIQIRTRRWVLIPLRVGPSVGGSRGMSSAGEAPERATIFNLEQRQLSLSFSRFLPIAERNQEGVIVVRRWSKNFSKAPTLRVLDF
jgi:hypothetical protein